METVKLIAMYEIENYNLGCLITITTSASSKSYQLKLFKLRKKQKQKTPNLKTLCIKMNNEN